MASHIQLYVKQQDNLMFQNTDSIDKKLRDSMKIKSIKPIGKRKVYDLSVKDAQHYVLEDGVVTHNTGPMYSADNVWILGRQQDKDNDGIQGYKFVINIEKSRFVKERSKITVSVTYDKGINRWSGLFEEAVDLGFIIKPKVGWYAIVDQSTKQPMDNLLREKDIVENGELWTTLLASGLADAIKEKYHLGAHVILEKEEIE